MDRKLYLQRTTQAGRAGISDDHQVNIKNIVLYLCITVPDQICFMKQLIAIIILSCILFGCNKSSNEDEYYTLSGLVLDYDSNLPIAGAKVYPLPICIGGCLPTDSAISNALGRVSFRIKIDGVYKSLHATKDNYLFPAKPYFYSNVFVSRTDTMYLARPSFVNVTVHKTGTYLPSDTIDIHVLGDNIPSSGQTGSYRTLHVAKADAPDKLYNLQGVYIHTPSPVFFGYGKLYFIKNIIRNGSVLSSQTDSTNIIQFGTQNFTLNY